MICQTVQTTDKQRMTDEEMLYDVLISQQKLAEAYNRFAGDNERSELSDILLIISEDDIKIAQDTLSVLKTNGWYNPVQAQQKEIIQMKQDFKRK